MSTVFLFGAGASRFSGPCVPENPPLGKDLFSALAAIPGSVASRLSPAVAASFTPDFEAGMAQLVAARPDLRERFLAEIGRYFVDFAPGDGNRYITFVQELRARAHAAVLATLNYDLLLDMAVNRAGYLISYALPAPPNNISLLKLHGSCHFIPDESRFRLDDVGGSLSGPLWQGPVRPAPIAALRDFMRRNPLMPPGIAVYAPGKPVLVGPDLVAEQQRFWAQAVDGASRIFVIGTRVVPADAHVWEPLQRARGALYYVSPEVREFQEWRRAVGRADAYPIERGFEEALPEILKRLTR